MWVLHNELTRIHGAGNFTPVSVMTAIGYVASEGFGDGLVLFDFDPEFGWVEDPLGWLEWRVEP